MLKWLSGIALLGVVVLAGCGTGTDSDSESAAAVKTNQIYLVRHAEKMSGPDPDLTEDGFDRAAALADRLSDVGIEVVYSTDFKRTVQTAEPIAQALGLDIQLYDPYDLAGFANKVLEAKQTVLVVGHSNTTPELSVELGGDPGDPIVEATEYDRLYILTVGDADVTTKIARYGKASPRDGGDGRGS